MADQNSEKQPLSAVEIEELLELEAKATPGEWRAEDDLTRGSTVWSQNTPTGSMMVASCGHAGFDAHNAALIAAMRNTLPRLIAMLQPPSDAAMREAVEAAESLLAQIKPNQYCAWEWPLRTLLSYVRAAQAQRLGMEDMERQRDAYVDAASEIAKRADEQEARATRAEAELARMTEREAHKSAVAKEASECALQAQRERDEARAKCERLAESMRRIQASISEARPSALMEIARESQTALAECGEGE